MFSQKDVLMEVNLTDREEEAVKALAARQGLSQEAVMRQALRMYQLVVEGAAELLMPAPNKTPPWYEHG